MAEVALNDPFREIRREDDAGAAFVLESKGNISIFSTMLTMHFSVQIALTNG